MQQGRARQIGLHRQRPACVSVQRCKGAGECAGLGGECVRVRGTEWGVPCEGVVGRKAGYGAGEAGCDRISGGGSGQGWFETGSGTAWTWGRWERVADVSLPGRMGRRASGGAVGGLRDEPG